MDVVFCTNCGMEFYVSDFKFTICPETNHLKAICPTCNWSEFSVHDEITVETWEDYPEPKFYVDMEEEE